MEFREFSKIGRLSRECIITEKIDGTNASIYIGEDGEFLVGSRTRWITPEHDNYGFATWADTHREELLGLGVGHHFGEWWGRGIQRNYAQTQKHFSLFNVSRWGQLRDSIKFPNDKPACCDVVPVLYHGPFEEHGVMKGITHALATLAAQGSWAAPGFMSPEGICIYHLGLGIYMKKTLEHDEAPKSKV